MVIAFARARAKYASLGEKQVKLAILPLGPANPKTLRAIESGLCKAFPEITCKILEDGLAIPQDAYHQSRKQYHSTTLLAKINNYAGENRIKRVLGVTDVDLYVPGLNFVFGEAYSPGRVALISLLRLKQEFYGLPPDRELFLERAVKEAVHEVGHTIGLKHCRNHSCVMFFSNSISDTDKKKALFCGECRSRSEFEAA